jgi:rsbT co-antagonist protein RsbR
LELSTPVVEFWDKILLLPLIGTLDSERSQVVMENLLNHIVKCRADIAVLDISGVQTWIRSWRGTSSKQFRLPA